MDKRLNCSVVEFYFSRGLQIKVLSLVIYFLSISTMAHAQSIVWTGLGDGVNWSDHGNWNPVRLPNSEDTVRIEDALNKIEINNISVSIYCLEIFRSSLDNNDSLVIGNSDTIAFYTSTCTIRNLGVLIIDSAGTHGIHNTNNSSFENLGLCYVKNCNYSGILNNDSFINSGSLRLSNFPSTAMENSGGSFENFDTISIDSAASIGIQNRFLAEFVNQTSGVIMISQTKEINSTAVENRATMTNHGKMLLNNLADDGIYCLGSNVSFINTDSIWIKNFGGIGILNDDPNNNLFENHKFISISTGTGPFSRAIINRSTFTNNGSLFIDNIMNNGIDCQGFNVFNNFDTILLDSLGARGIDLGTFSSFLNSAEAYVSITRSEIAVANNNASFTNEGDLVLSNFTVNGILNNGSDAEFRNMDSIHIQNDAVGTIIIRNINSASLNNEIAGYIFLNNTVDLTYAINLDNSVLNNHGNIILQGVRGLSLRLHEASTFTQSATGQLHFSNISGGKIEIGEGSTFDCSGVVNIN